MYAWYDWNFLFFSFLFFSFLAAEFLGFDDYIPSFASTVGSGEDILKGVNYASGGSGIRPETGQHVVMYT